MKPGRLVSASMIALLPSLLNETDGTFDLKSITS